MCPQGQFIDGSNVKFQEPGGPQIDDQAITGLKFTCSLPSNTNMTSEITEEGTNAGSWLKYKKFGAKYLCSAQARVDFTEFGGDTTGVNSLGFYACDYKSEDTVAYGDSGDFTFISTSVIGEWQTFRPSKLDIYNKFASGISVATRTYYPAKTYFDSINFLYSEKDKLAYTENLGQVDRDERNTYQYKDYKCADGHYIKSIRVREEKVVIGGSEVNTISAIQFACSDDPNKANLLKHEFRSSGTWSAWTELGDQYIYGNG